MDGMPVVNSDCLEYRGGKLFMEEVHLGAVEEASTPCYVYSAKQIRANIHKYKTAFGSMSHRIGFSVKSNNNLTILKMMNEAGFSAVTVSGNEIRLALLADFEGNRIFLNGNGKQDWEIELAIKNRCKLNVDSLFDARNIVRVASNKEETVEVLVRLNPATAVEVHPFLDTGAQTSKFGVGVKEMEEVLKVIDANPKVIIVGIQVHLGSTIQNVKVYSTVHAFIKKTLARNFDSFKHVKIINMGGGLDIDYRHTGDIPSPMDLAKSIPGEPEFQIMVEPGRSLIANTGLLLTTTLGVKENGEVKFIVVDGSMTDLIRPALYSAYHHIIPVEEKKDDEEAKKDKFHVVGPVCESGDFLGKDRELARPSQGDLLAVLDVGAYGAVMASNYNMRGRGMEILVDGKEVNVIAKGETFEDMVRKFHVEEVQVEEEEEEEVESSQF